MSTGIAYSIVVPIYNDGYLAESFCEQASKSMDDYLHSHQLQDQYEIIFVNDGSRDNSLSTLLALKQKFPFIRVVNLSRNFGQHHAIACGYSQALGDIIIRSNVDMQDHPSNIPLFIEEIKKGECDLVIGQYPERKSPWHTKLSSHLYFILFEFLTGIKTPKNTSPLRAMSRRYIDHYKSLKEHGRFPQGLDVWLGFKCHYVAIQHHPRPDKKSSYNFFSRMSLAIDGLLYFTEKPLKLITYFGFISAFIGVTCGIIIFIEKILGLVTVPGYASLMTLGLIAFGIQLTITGLVGLYTAKIFTEVKCRPLYIIENIY